jgi:flagellar biosynthesis protein
MTDAVALGYTLGAMAPKILAKGKGEIALAILERARELEIPTRSEPAMLAFLLELELFEVVPPELYTAVSEVLAWAYEQDGRAADLRPEGS